ncbi:MAG: DoxX family protein [Acidobacteriota bacterium]|nr:DoxX family protein [Acidobacteriota bacterium]
MTIQAAIHVPAAPELDRSRAALWTGRVLFTLSVLFLAFDAAMKILQPAAAVAGTTQLGYSANVLLPLGIIQVVCLALYLIPRTAVLGAILWTGYLGGAVATHVRIGNPLFSHILFPVYVAALLWGALWLRDRRVRALLPLA